MIIRFALYKNEDITRRIRPEDIRSTEEYREMYRHQLFCCEEGCDAQLELAHRNGQPYFRTWRGSKHAETCVFAFENDPTKVSAYAEESVQVRVSADHKRRSLSYANKKRQQEEGTLPVPPRATERPSPKRPVVERGGARLVASVDPNARPTTGREREPAIPTRRAADITAADVGRNLNVYGRINGADIKADSVQFFFDTNGDPAVSVLFFNRFRDNSHQQYGWVEQIAQLIIGGQLPNLQVSCIGVCELKGTRFEFQAMDEESISVGDTWLAVFMRDLRISKLVE